MTSQSENLGTITIQRLNQQLKIFEGRSEKDKNTTVRQYCEFSERAIKIPLSDLAQQYRIYAESQGSVANNLAYFLCRPRIIFGLEERVDSRRREEINQAGRRVMSQIAYQWDYFFRLVRGPAGTGGGENEKSLKSSESNIYSKENVELARKRLQDMLKEMRNKKFHWENFVRDQLVAQEREEKEIKEEETFVRLLENLLRAQTDKVLRARKGHQPEVNRGSEEVKPLERQKQQPRRQIRMKQPEVKLKNIEQLLDIKGYFQRKWARSNEQTLTQDPITKNQQKCKFNAAALRFSSAFNKI